MPDSLTDVHKHRPGAIDYLREISHLDPSSHDEIYELLKTCLGFSVIYFKLDCLNELILSLDATQHTEKIRDIAKTVFNNFGEAPQDHIYTYYNILILLSLATADGRFLDDVDIMRIRDLSNSGLEVYGRLYSVFSVYCSNYSRFQKDEMFVWATAVFLNRMTSEKTREEYFKIYKIVGGDEILRKFNNTRKPAGVTIGR